MAFRLRARFLVIGIILSVAIVPHAHAAAPGCGQARVETLLGAPPPPAASRFYIEPDQAAAPFYQWENNNGYCGEVSLISAGLANGQWVSQYDTRLICGGFFGPESNGSGLALLQAGQPIRKSGNYNAELLIENPSQGLAGPYDYDWAGRCAANAGLALVQYPAATGYLARNSGLAGYQDFMSWIKAQLIAGDQVTLGVMLNPAAGGADPQYDHIVNVIKIGTNHSPTDPSYYPDDVLYFDDHGVYTLRLGAKGWSFTTNPAIPPGAGSDTKGCTPYIFAYTFAALVKTRAQENAKGAAAYAVVMPGSNTTVKTNTGNSGAAGEGTATIGGPHDAAFAIAGPLDQRHETMPVSLAILATSSFTGGAWVKNPADLNSSPPAGYNYENPYIGGPAGTCDTGSCVSNAAPNAMKIVLQATVHGLTPGVSYNLYEYDFPPQSGAFTGTTAALAIPTRNFNAQSGEARAVSAFVAASDTYTAAAISRSSREIIIFRAVPANAP